MSLEQARAVLAVFAHMLVATVIVPKIYVSAPKRELLSSPHPRLNLGGKQVLANLKFLTISATSPVVEDNAHRELVHPRTMSILAA